jgi:hypothetical protein
MGTKTSTRRRMRGGCPFLMPEEGKPFLRHLHPSESRADKMGKDTQGTWAAAKPAARGAQIIVGGEVMRPAAAVKGFTRG